MSTTVTRADLDRLQGMTPKLLRFFEDLFSAGADAASNASGALTATTAIQNATVLTLSPNAALNNERVVTFDPAGFAVVDTGPNGTLTVSLFSVAQTNGGYPVTFNAVSETHIDVPSSGTMLTTANAGSTIFPGPYASDAAAATAGVPLNGTYRKTGGAVSWRQV